MVKYGAPILRDARVAEAAELFPDILKVASGLALSLDTTMWEKILGGEVFQNFSRLVHVMDLRTM